ncbi:hypothetical protein [Aliarcobacter butzleri]|uniref:hypothetical protein n=1 Tax=Aliarcobacter butzleri TaxID=28197 RepID=UPI0018A01F1C|nr:hypothetical protein [Aliarcobacter butzleri]MBF7065754.1 hypothetical protein [Aliarcobacter butzleri]
MFQIKEFTATGGDISRGTLPSVVGMINDFLEKANDRIKNVIDIKYNVMPTHSTYHVTAILIYEIK